ncbi:MAG: hypothetical protein HYX38_12190 [Rhodospirillales bacterium]|nr:hypothetical protein [Rhodospirillales bacterium]
MISIEVLGSVLGAAKSLLKNLAAAPEDAPIQALKSELARIADNIDGLRESVDRLTKEVSALPKAIKDATKYELQFKAAAQRESAARSLSAGVIDHAYKALIEAEGLDPGTYELWLLMVFCRCQALKTNEPILVRHGSAEELNKATKYTMAEATLRPVEKLALLHALLIAALWLRERAAAEQIFMGANTILTDGETMTLANAPSLLLPFRYLSSAGFGEFMMEAERRLQYCYEAQYRKIWQQLRDKGECDAGELELFRSQARLAFPERKPDELDRLQELQDLGQQEREVRLPVPEANPVHYEYDQEENGSEIGRWLVVLVIAICPMAIWRGFYSDVEVPRWLIQAGIGTAIGVLLLLSKFRIVWYIGLCIFGFLFMSFILGYAALPFVLANVAVISGTVAVFTLGKVCSLLVARVLNWRKFKAATARDLQTAEDREAKRKVKLEERASIAAKRSLLLSKSAPKARSLGVES